MPSLLPRAHPRGIAIVIVSFLLTLAGAKTNLALLDLLVERVTPRMDRPSPPPTSMPVNV